MDTLMDLTDEDQALIEAIKKKEAYEVIFAEGTPAWKLLASLRARAARFMQALSTVNIDDYATSFELRVRIEAYRMLAKEIRVVLEQGEAALQQIDQDDYAFLRTIEGEAKENDA